MFKSVTMLTLSENEAICVISRVRSAYTVKPQEQHVAHQQRRDPRCRRPLRLGDAFGDGKDRVSPVPDRSLPAILSGAQEADILLT
jgi:glutamine phosphoribosylpyrophosphate amidotransferase